eukprot:scaffold54043_cov41-Prasinocladus_malaysianus.AAC.2
MARRPREASILKHRKIDLITMHPEHPLSTSSVLPLTSSKGLNCWLFVATEALVGTLSCATPEG